MFLDEMKITREKVNKVNMVFYVKGHNLNFIIRNIINTMASDVKIKSKP